VFAIKNVYGASRELELFMYTCFLRRRLCNMFVLAFIKIQIKINAQECFGRK